MPERKSSLTRYRRKRDFGKTAEPAGDAPVAASRYPRFVVQKHDATRLHYDLRLEVEGTFKSWAVTRGPSLDPREKRLAVEVEDHPLDYGDFEGTIPQGEYGGGTVMIWDRGFWTADNGEPAEALRKGELKFTLGGEKLRGSFVLVRMARDKTKSGRRNWLLIKHRDDWAKAGDGEGVLSADRSVASGRAMAAIAAERKAKLRPFMAITAGGTAQPKGGKRSSVSLADARPTADGRVLGIKITHPDRLVWRDPDITKLDLARYVASVGAWMLPHVAKRPCSLLRAPDGVGGEQFFQRHLMRGMPDEIIPTPVKGEAEPYLSVETVAGLVALVQFGTVEFHPWNSAEGEADLPGRLVFDLDPAPDVPFAIVVDAAQELRRRLSALGLVPFCKTTGGKGLHVVTPLEGGKRLKWDDAKTFAHAVCASLAEAAPERYVTSMSKRRRTGRIFLDYLRNERTATAVAPLSPRARAGATVSMPLDWGQVRRDLDPARFTVLTAPALLVRSRPWRGYERAGRPLESAVRSLLESHA